MFVFSIVKRLKALFEANHFVINSGELSGSSQDCIFVTAFGFHSAEVVAKPMVTSLYCVGSVAESMGCVSALGFFLGIWLLMSLPPDILLLGQRFSQDTKCFSEGHLLKLVPVSARISSAAISLMP